MLNNTLLRTSELKSMTTSMIDMNSNMRSDKILKLILKILLELELNSKKKPLTGRLPQREFKICTPLPGTIKSLKLNSPQLLLRDQLTSIFNTQISSLTDTELLLKLIKTSEETSRVTS
jgi:hypothetical protein